MGSVPFAVGAFSKLFLKAGCRSVRVDGLPQFLERLKGDRGVLTGEFAGDSALALLMS